MTRKVSLCQPDVAAHITYLLQAPANENLSRGLVVFLSQVLQHRFLHSSSLYKRRVCLDDDIVLLKPLGDLLARAPGMDLVLANGDFAASAARDISLQLLKMLNAVV